MCQEITTIIFSKNRACQLEALLRGLDIKNINVLYTFDQNFELGYKKVIEMYPDVNFILQKNFKEQILNILEKTEYILFLCDDDIVIKTFDCNCLEFQEFKKNEDIICFCLRLSRDYDYDFLKERKVEIPKIIDGKWEWKKANRDWGYPMSMSAHIFRTKDIIPPLQKNSFLYPNTMEKILRKVDFGKPLMIGLEKAIFINNLANQVQIKYPNKNGNISAEYLNDMFMSGLVIDIDDMLKKANKSKSCFMIEKYKWKKI